MMDVTLICNGQDFSPVLSDYSVTYETDNGKTVKALDGTEYAGNLTSRPMVTFSMRPMSGAQAKTYYDALISSSPASCTYTDNATNADRAAQMRLTTNLDFVFVLRSSDGGRYYSGGQITLRGVSCFA